MWAKAGEAAATTTPTGLPRLSRADGSSGSLSAHRTHPQRVLPRVCAPAELRPRFTPACPDCPLKGSASLDAASFLAPIALTMRIVYNLIFTFTMVTTSMTAGTSNEPSFAPPRMGISIVVK